VAFFRWFDDGGISRCPSPDPLIDAGLELANFDSPVSSIPADIDTYGECFEKKISSYIAASSSESHQTLSSEFSVTHSPFEPEIEKDWQSCPKCSGPKSPTTLLPRFFIVLF
jgi:hypothetical protein